MLFLNLMICICIQSEFKNLDNFLYKRVINSKSLKRYYLFLPIMYVFNFLIYLLGSYNIQLMFIILIIIHFFNRSLLIFFFINLFRKFLVKFTFYIIILLSSLLSDFWPIIKFTCSFIASISTLNVFSLPYVLQLWCKL